jgi:hypothetical protein
MAAAPFGIIETSCALCRGKDQPVRSASGMILIPGFRQPRYGSVYQPGSDKKVGG